MIICIVKEFKDWHHLTTDKQQHLMLKSYYITTNISMPLQVNTQRNSIKRVCTSLQRFDHKLIKMRYCIKRFYMYNVDILHYTLVVQ